MGRQARQQGKLRSLLEPSLDICRNVGALEHNNAPPLFSPLLSTHLEQWGQDLFPPCFRTECEAEVIPAGLHDALDNISFDDYVDVDNSAVVCGTITDDDIIAQVTGGEEPVVEADKNDEQEEAPTQPSDSQLLEAMGVARLFFSFEEGEEDAFRHIHALENKAMAIAFKEKQKVITDYFRQ
ncbi:hypothetical protein HPB50_011625 [Hyalomma asiaticum]|uniref:Uncharacterized protein n=1 Tax=Hyalomma asiaticum TaxID=266040 RepID=A0ACB7TIZ4_HYAAI|nr:hypothetical protein HPB50_011625 [Hyalomma asiaticum]